MGRPNRATRAAITQRRADAIDLKLAGVDWLAIGRKLAADPSINTDGVAYPQGYGIDKYKRGLEPPSDKRLIELACKDVSKALVERTTVLDGNADELRQLMVERLERLFFTVYRASRDFAGALRFEGHPPILHLSAGNGRGIAADQREHRASVGQDHRQHRLAFDLLLGMPHAFVEVVVSQNWVCSMVTSNSTVRVGPEGSVIM
ncbi:hypothetical protein ACFXKR_18385 [Streptomyces violascens]|uniref:hypothetical protein n=1 Tax=Streptomyces violascens TaxID=67381 RepID=UPI0036ABF440